MSARRAAGVAGAALPWLLAFAVLLSWVRCGPEPEGTAPPESVLSGLEAPQETLGPPPREGGDGLAAPVEVVGGEEGWLVTWRNRAWLRGVRLDATGTPLDASPGLVLEAYGTGFPTTGSCRTTALSGTYLAACLNSIALLGPAGPPRLVPAPWTQENWLGAAAATAGHGVAVVLADGWWGLSAEGETRWEVDLPDLVDPPLPAFAVTTPESFLVGGNVRERPAPGEAVVDLARVQPLGPDGTAGALVELAEGPLLGLAEGPGGVLAWLGTAPPRLELLEAATGLPVGRSVEAPPAHALLPWGDGWLLENGAQGWRIDAELNLTPVDLPFDAGWADWSYGAAAGDLLQAALAEDLDHVTTTRVPDDGSPRALLARGLERLEVLALGVGDGLRLVVERALYPDAPRRRVWRVDADGHLLDEEAVDLGAPGIGDAAVGGDGRPWLVALGELGAVRLFEVEARGTVSDRGTLPCDLGLPPEALLPPGSDPGEKQPVIPAVARVSDGWVVACLDVVGSRALDGELYAEAARPAVHRLDSAFESMGGLEPLSEWGLASLRTQVVATATDEGVVVGWPIGSAADPPRLRLALLDPTSGEHLDERTLEDTASPIGIDARGSRLAVMGMDPFGPALYGAVLDGFGDSDPTPLHYFPGLRSFDAVGPVFVGNAVWMCSTLTYPAEGRYPVVCVEPDREHGSSAGDEGIRFDAAARVGAIAGTDEALSVGFWTWRDGAIRSALATLAAEGGGDGDGGLDDGGDEGDGGEVTPDAGDAGDGDAGRPDAGNGGDGGGVTPDAGRPDAGATDAGAGDAGPEDAGTPDAGLADVDAGTADAGGGDAGTADAGPGDAGAPDAGIPTATPLDEGGCGGCSSSSGGEAAAFLALLALYGMRRRRRPPPRAEPHP